MRRRVTRDEARADLLIIGGGVVGTTAALAAAQAGMAVTVVDWGRNAGSTANAGSLHVQMQSRVLRQFPELAPQIEASLPLYVQAVAEWERLEAAYGGFELVRDGGLMVAEDADQMRFLEAKAERERRMGVDAEMLDRPALEAIAPWLGPHVVGAELCREEGKLNPLITNAKLRSVAEDVGTTFAVDRIRALETDGTGIVARGARSHRAGQAILAASWGVRELATGLGLTVPITWEPLHMNITEPAAYAMRHLVQHAERPITLKQFVSGQIVIGGGWPARFDGGDKTPEVKADSLVGNVALAARLAPAIGGLRILRTWAGLNNVADGGSIIGRAPGAARVVFAVPGDAGYTLGPLVGRAAAAIALGDDAPFDTEPYGVGRFG